ncbi:hypothetical protein [Streptomyces sp. PA5.6]|uniref:hypothetical protein n=1 Tax=Streptomyces sp. PA5.6 TaxID=3035651 RepID=UPI00390467A7
MTTGSWFAFGGLGDVELRVETVAADVWVRASAGSAYISYLSADADGSRAEG